MNETDDAATIKYAPSVLNSLLADMERLAWVTKNPLFIWNGISLCVEQNLPVPEYALDYIKAVATALAPFTRETILKDKKNKIQPEEISKRVLDALQITTRGGPSKCFRKLASRPRGRGGARKRTTPESYASAALSQPGAKGSGRQDAEPKVGEGQSIARWDKTSPQAFGLRDCRRCLPLPSLCSTACRDVFP